MRGYKLALARRFGGQHTHAVLHLRGHAIVAHQLARVAQAQRLALHHEQPERVARLRHQCAALRSALEGSSSLAVRDDGPYAQLEHRVDRVIKRRDVLVAVKPTG